MFTNQDIPRPEYPRPQMVRDEWINLNGEWEFEFDHGNSGKDRGLYKADKLTGKIIVPFCPESRLSGIEYKDFIAAVWYRRQVEIPREWLSKRVLLHFGAVDYNTDVWVNGEYAGNHMGGYSSFSFEITELLKPGNNVIIVNAKDDTRSRKQPVGKQQYWGYYSNGCHYTRTTGIWQTVWLECVPRTYVANFRFNPDPENGCIHISASIKGCAENCRLSAKAFYKGKPAGEASSLVTGHNAYITLKLSEIHLWEPGKPELYDLELVLSKDSGDASKDCCSVSKDCGAGEDSLAADEAVIDKVKSYFGLRTVSIGDKAILINGKTVFQRLILDQGFYPDGIYTAPSDDDLRRDIEISMAMGFNGARLHQKVFEPRYLYWADKLGYMV